MRCWGAKAVAGHYSPIALLPEEVNDGVGWGRVAAGYRFTCAKSKAIIGRVAQEYCWGDAGNYRTDGSNPGWRIMAKGTIYSCLVNGTNTGNCAKISPAPSGPASETTLCTTMCREDIPQLLLYINRYVIMPGSSDRGMPAVCNNMCCRAPPAAYSAIG